MTLGDCQRPACESFSPRIPKGLDEPILPLAETVVKSDHDRCQTVRPSRIVRTG
jgi:hypothetical protein